MRAAMQSIEPPGPSDSGSETGSLDPSSEEEV